MKSLKAEHIKDWGHFEKSKELEMPQSQEDPKVLNVLDICCEFI